MAVRWASSVPILNILAEPSPGRPDPVSLEREDLGASEDLAARLPGASRRTTPPTPGSGTRLRGGVWVRVSALVATNRPENGTYLAPHEGLPRVWLTFHVWGSAPRKDGSHAQEVSAGVQA